MISLSMIIYSNVKIDYLRIVMALKLNFILDYNNKMLIFLLKFVVF
jgi:hypothetical protein